MQQERYNLVNDVVLTYRAASEGTGTNYHATHALGCLAFGVGFGVAGFWLLLAGVGLFDASRYFGPAIFLLLGWRVLLKRALWIWKVQTTLYGVARRPPIMTWMSVLAMILLVGFVVGALLHAGGYVAT